VGNCADPAASRYGPSRCSPSVRWGWWRDEDGSPVRCRHRMPSMTWPLSCHSLPLPPFFGGSGAICCHAAETTQLPLRVTIRGDLLFARKRL
jgi:hypothetical protein